MRPGGLHQSYDLSAVRDIGLECEIDAGIADLLIEWSFARHSSTCFPPPAVQTRYPERMPNVGPWEIVLLLLLALLLFGAKRLPEIGKSMGKGMREFKDSLAGNASDDEPAELPMQTTDTTVGTRDRDTV